MHPFGIKGLRFEKNDLIDEGGGCYFANSTPFYIVYHGRSEFSYPHYGVHLGQEDNLTFLGHYSKNFTGLFLDCRKNSPTWGVRAEIGIQPSHAYRLIIPPGVGHSFAGLENVYTINNYKLFLPEIERLTNGSCDWQIEHDVINVPLDEVNVPSFVENRLPAADMLYAVLAKHHRVHLVGSDDIQYPVIQDIPLADGSTVRMRFTADLKKDEKAPTELAVRADGIEIHDHIKVKSSSTSGIIIVPYFGDLTISNSISSLRKGSYLTTLPVDGNPETQLQFIQDDKDFSVVISSFQELSVSTEVKFLTTSPTYFLVRSPLTDYEHR